jgi:hypothetical protein
MSRLSLKMNWLKDKPREITNHFIQRICGIYLIVFLKTIKRSQHLTSWTRKHLDYDWLCPKIFITSFKSITMFCGTYTIQQNVPHIQIECEEYCMSHITLSWIWMMLCSQTQPMRLCIVVSRICKGPLYRGLGGNQGHAQITPNLPSGFMRKIGDYVEK